VNVHEKPCPSYIYNQR